MMVFWEKWKCSSKELGEKLFLDSGTLTPVLKSIEKKSVVKRERSSADERLLDVSITEKGMGLSERTVEVPGKVAGCINLDGEEAMSLYRTLYKILKQNTAQDAD